MEQQSNAQIPDRIVRIIQGLMEKTVDRGASKEEAEAAALKVQELLLQYNLQIADIRAKSNKRKRDFIKHSFTLDGVQGRHDSNWVETLINVLAQNNMCQAVGIRGGVRSAMIILGEEVNVKIVTYLIDQLIPRIEAACQDAWRIYEGVEKRNTFRRGFLQGCVAGLSKKLMEQKAKMAQSDGRMMALIRTNDIELTQHVEDTFKNFKPVKNDRSGNLQKSNLSQIIGFEKGYNMPINKGLGNSENGGAIKE